MPLKIHFVQDAHAAWKPGSLARFWQSIWPEAATALGSAGLNLSTEWTTGEIRRSASGNLHFNNLDPVAINIVLTDHLPLYWDNGRALSGVATRYEGYTLAVLALDYAHGNRIPFLSVNTCLHEIVHILYGDIRERRPTAPFWGGQIRETRADATATRLWLFGRGAEELRENARRYSGK